MMFSILFFLTLNDDLKRESRRPLFFLAFAIMGWITTMPALLAPSAITTTQGALTITSSGHQYTYTALNTTTKINNPFPVATLMTYILLYVPVFMILFLLLWLYYVRWFRKEVGIGTDDLV